MKKNIKIDIEKEIIKTVQEEKSAWEDEVFFITDKIAFNMRNLIKTCRKNYWGIFDTQTDPITSKNKIWPPLTQWLTESVIKNVDIDTKDLNFKAKKPEAMGLTSLVRNVVTNWVDTNFFGEDLDIMERVLAIDGTCVWKTWKEGKKMEMVAVDLLNFYINPNAKSIQETPSVIERSIMTVKEFNEMDWWKKDKAKTKEGIHQTDGNLTSYSTSGGTNGIEIFERWGLMPKSWITGIEKDKKEMIEGQIVISNLEDNPVVHFVKENKTKDTQGNAIKPYEEAWLRRVPGRWYGVGIPEMLLGLQTWLNVVVNIRITRALVSQLGIFKIKRGRKITPQMLKKLVANGAILVESMDDIEQLVMKEASQSSYQDEELIVDWAQKVTQAYESVTGEPLPASQSATASAIQSKAAQSAFVMIREGIGMFLERWLQRQAWPILQDNLKKGDIIRMTGDYNEIRMLDEKIVNLFIYKKLNEMTEKKQIVDPVEIENEKIGALEKLRNMGNDRFVELLDEVKIIDYDVRFFVTNEKFDKGVISKDLIALGQIAPQYSDIIVKNVMDLMGLDVNQFERAKTQPTEQPTEQQTIQPTTQQNG